MTWSQIFDFGGSHELAKDGSRSIEAVVVARMEERSLPNQRNTVRIPTFAIMSLSAVIVRYLKNSFDIVLDNKLSQLAIIVLRSST